MEARGARSSSILFFFSSRRRHTRWTGDWSSDVCSSDLCRASGLAALLLLVACAGAPVQEMSDARQAVAAAEQVLAGKPASATLESARKYLQAAQARSEERRVGKEWSTRVGGGRAKKRMS